MTGWDPERLRVMELRLDELRDDLATLRTLMRTDHASALNKIRYVTEKLLVTLCRREGVSWGQVDPTLERMIGPLLARGVIPKDVGVHVRTIQANASPGSHFQESPLGQAHVRVAEAALLEFLEWYARTSRPGDRSAPRPRTARSVGRYWVLATAAVLAVVGVVFTVTWLAMSHRSTPALAPAVPVATATEAGRRSVRAPVDLVHPCETDDCSPPLRAWCDESDDRVACCLNGLVADGIDGVCVCPPGGATSSEALANGCARAALPDGLTREEVLGVVSAAVPEIRACYEEALERGSTEGDLSVSFRVTPFGRVRAARFRASSLPDAEAQRCVLARIRSLEFPPPRGAGELDYAFPLVFAPN